MTNDKNGIEFIHNGLRVKYIIEQGLVIVDGAVKPLPDTAEDILIVIIQKLSDKVLYG